MKIKVVISMILLVVALVAVSGCTSMSSVNKTNATNTFNQSGVSFTYPGNWSVDNLTSKETAAGMIVKVGSGTVTITSTSVKNNVTNGSSTNSTNKTKTDNCFFVTKTPTEPNTHLIALSGATNVTHSSVVVDGVNCTQISSNSKDEDGVVWREIDVLLRTGGFDYILTYQKAPASDFDESEYQSIINSFHLT